MAQTNARNLKKLITLQKLGAARLEASLSVTSNRKTVLDEERDALIAMQDRRYDGDAFTVDPSLLIKRLGANALATDQIEQQLESERICLLKEQRRVELLEDRLETVRNDAERRELASLIEEFVSRKTTAPQDYKSRSR
ncbi:hypothetical protein [Brucella sp. NBRC 12950]|jgi:hypothetical protein|uniref:hypothetical protein n=1 Tax=Brucella sp. NBRC 12950 TaxID=2994518 RepID=UPI0024A13B36|nr:hypothetical protein [Brucella sp. NBRC 12950]GLU25876.1 hypothetical protein Brsp01_11090 [Brucella sp. NBRC 12950]